MAPGKFGMDPEGLEGSRKVQDGSQGVPSSSPSLLQPIILASAN